MDDGKRVSKGLNGSSNRAIPQEESGATTSQIVLAVFEHVVAQGFRDLAALIHEYAAGSSPSDMALVTAILQACLGVPGIESCHDQIMGFINASNTARVAVTPQQAADTSVDLKSLLALAV